MRQQRAKFSRGNDVAKTMDCSSVGAHLPRLLDDGRICLSNNAAERALGRKSWLFCGSDRGGHRAAMMYSLIVTAKMNDIDPELGWPMFLPGCTRLTGSTIRCHGIGAPMPGLSRRLKQLDEELLALGEETMLLEELDGFIAGLLICPDLIKPGDWLPLIWSRDGDDQRPGFDDLDHANKVLGLIMEHYNSVARTLMEHPERYGPLFSVDTRNGDILWELWIEGFEKAVKLQPAAWQNLLNADADTAAAMRGMLTLVDVADQYMPRKNDDEINKTAPDNIARWVVTLNDWRLTNYQPPHSIDPPTSSVPTKKVGRMIPARVAQERNTRSAADFTKHSHRGLHRMLTRE